MLADKKGERLLPQDIAESDLSTFIPEIQGICVALFDYASRDKKTKNKKK